MAVRSSNWLDSRIPAFLERYNKEIGKKTKWSLNEWKTSAWDDLDKMLLRDGAAMRSGTPGGIAAYARCLSYVVKFLEEKPRDYEVNLIINRVTDDLSRFKGIWEPLKRVDWAYTKSERLMISESLIKVSVLRSTLQRIRPI